MFILFGNILISKDTNKFANREQFFIFLEKLCSNRKKVRIHLSFFTLD